jgi:ubiquinone/menaquinone biosynthesis C-methylase UbiE
MTTTGNIREWFIPALSYHILTPLYDPITQTLVREEFWKRRLIAAASLRKGEQVLDLGCGTGTLTRMLKQQHPGTGVVGLDADPEVLALARKKLASAHLEVTLTQGHATDLPYPNTSFDCVVSSLLFHHLDEEQTRRAAREVIRVLRPGGRFLVADWGKAETPLMRLAFFPIQFLDGFATTQKNVEGALPDLFADAGFKGVETIEVVRTLFGTLSLYQAYRKG